MAALDKALRPNAAPALFRLLSDSALSRAALGACGMPLVILEADTPQRSIAYVNPAFEEFFGYRGGEALGRPLGALLFRGDEALAHRLLAEPASRRELRGFGRDGAARCVEVAVGAVRGPDGRLTHWVLAFSDRSELERLRAELEALKIAAGG